jgi:hypothetical protein
MLNIYLKTKNHIINFSIDNMTILLTKKKLSKYNIKSVYRSFNECLITIYYVEFLNLG